MKKHLTIFLFLLFFAFASLPLMALTPEELISDAKAAFLSSDYTLAAKRFERFFSLWPDYKGSDAFVLKYLLSSVYSLEAEIEDFKSERLKELGRLREQYALSLSRLEQEELDLAIKLCMPEKSTQSWSELTKVSKRHLKHYLLSGLYPQVVDDPFATLEWVEELLKASEDLEGEVVAELNLIKVKVLACFASSPLVVEHCKTKLESAGFMPLEDIAESAALTAFEMGNDSQKRRAAFGGYHFAEVFSKNKNRAAKWLRYLKKRGISTSDAWFHEWR